MQLVIEIPEGLKKDFELEQWTALSCMEMKNALMNGTSLPKGHGRLIDADVLEEMKEPMYESKGEMKGYGILMNDIRQFALTIIEANKESD